MAEFEEGARTAKPGAHAQGKGIFFFATLKLQSLRATISPENRNAENFHLITQLRTPRRDLEDLHFLRSFLLPCSNLEVTPCIR